ncbi:SEC12-like protein 2 [Ricinus communis]|uniref:Prolactin regulatory element-binding protein, putative n=1 Tax=Ricinus communis TaxID=3988 RepID=B9SJ58_RICCO|nr:SEC12-like protein 2 [Ricinus communis]EEF36367.1 Prolactin regulatory element-binding protein, putative [Ricinus communis]|eukprot:XP_002526027.1 SEC12-like protein 2 [Ricinus communis]
MGKSNKPDSLSFQKYGVPFYSAAWVPYKLVRSKLQSSHSDHENDHEEIADQYYVLLAGGGGEGRSGIPNALVLSRFDFTFNSLSPQPVAKLGTGSDLPYRMVVHPGGDGLVCALPNSCRFFEWDEVKDNEAHKLGLKESEKALTQLEDVGQQLALAFNSESSALAVGGEDGRLRVFKWPSMEIFLNEAEAHPSLKDLCFSPDGKFLVSLGGRGPGRVWDVTSSTAVASLSKENDEVFASCRFSQTTDQTQVLYIAAITDKGGSIVTWDASSWNRIGSKHITRDGISSFNVSPDGKFLAVGTSQGDVLLLNSTRVRVQKVVRKAHLGMVTALAFSHDSRALVSASLDSSARVTLVQDVKSGGLSLWLIIFVILLAMVAYFMKNEGLLPFLG